MDILYTQSGIKLELASIAALQYSLNIAFTIKDFSPSWRYGKTPLLR